MCACTSGLKEPQLKAHILYGGAQKMYIVFFYV